MMKHSVIITPEHVLVDGNPLIHNEKGSALLTELYRNHIGDYPKFFKMDTLSKLGFIASELLLNIEGNRNFEPREDRAVIFFNRNASLQADTHYQSTIQDPEHFFPSPAAFVYTLPNIASRLKESASLRPRRCTWNLLYSAALLCSKTVWILSAFTCIGLSAKSVHGYCKCLVSFF